MNRKEFHESLKTIIEFAEKYNYAIGTIGTKYINLFAIEPRATFDYNWATEMWHTPRIDKHFTSEDLINLENSIIEFNGCHPKYSDIPIEETYNYVCMQSIRK